MQLLAKLLCPVIKKAGTQDVAVHRKAMELLHLIDTRLKPSPSIHLPTLDILNTARSAGPNDVRIRPLALVYLRHALQRMSPADKVDMVRVLVP
jgi:hypothetical protein